MNALFTIAAMLAIGGLCVFLPMASRFRHRRVVKCPETDQPAEIIVDASPTSSPRSGKKSPAIRKCSLWPKRKGCTQNCLS